MGFLLSKIWKSDMPVLMIGLDYAGKASILYYLKEKIGKNSLIKYPSRYKTFFNYKGLNIIDIDLGGGCDKILRRRDIQHFLGKIEGIIFVIDSGDIGRLEEVCDYFDILLSNKGLNNQPILVLANKQDLNGALCINDIIKKLEIEKIKDRDWILLGTSVKTGEGIEEGFDWLITILNKRQI